MKVLIVVLAVQFIIATVQLFSARPARFGWQMYAGISQPVGLTAMTDRGPKRIDLDDYLARQRGDLDVAAVIPAICAREQASAIRYRLIPEQQAREVPCDHLTRATKKSAIDSDGLFGRLGDVVRAATGQVSRSH